MSEPRDDELWECANRISDKIVDLLNGELAAPDYTPSQGLAGQMLAMMAMLETAPPNPPAELVAVRDAIEACLASMRAIARLFAAHGYRPRQSRH